jgi:choline monooxygenase
MLMQRRIAMATPNTAGLTAREVASVRAPIAKALTLPSRLFVSEEFFRLEVEKVFHCHWMALAFEVTVPHIGDMRPIELFGMPLVIVRGDDRHVRVFHNVCPYDGCLAVLEPQQGAKEIEVLYHGWKYDLRGRLTAIPFWDGTPAGDTASLSSRGGNLVEVKSARALGVVWVDLGGKAGNFDSYLNSLRTLLADYDLESLVQVEDDGILAREGRTLKTNWKTYLENAAINILHEAFTHDSYRKSGEVPRVRDGKRTYGLTIQAPLLAFSYEMQDLARTYPSGGATPHLGRSRERPPQRGYFITYYPNVVIPIRPNLMRLNICLPESAGLTRIFHCGYFHPDAPSHPDFKPFHQRIVSGFREAYREDGIAVEAVQKGRHSPALSQNFYAPFWDDLHYALNNLVVDDLTS